MMLNSEGNVKMEMYSLDEIKIVNLEGNAQEYNASLKNEKKLLTSSKQRDTSLQRAV